MIKNNIVTQLNKLLVVFLSITILSTEHGADIGLNKIQQIWFNRFWYMILFMGIVILLNDFYKWYKKEKIK